MVSAESAAERLNLSDELEDALFGQWLAEQRAPAEPGMDASQPVLGLPVDPNDLSALDAVKIRCTVQGPLKWLIPHSALTAMAGGCCWLRSIELQF